MADWLNRYRDGECAGVWAEMEALGPAIRESKNRKAADRVVRETMERSRKNVLRLIEELLALGYRFQSGPEPDEPDHPLEIRIEHALEFARLRPQRSSQGDVWSHPALAWVEEEEIDLP